MPVIGNAAIITKNPAISLFSDDSSGQMVSAFLDVDGDEPMTSSSSPMERPMPATPGYNCSPTMPPTVPSPGSSRSGLANRSGPPINSIPRIQSLFSGIGQRTVS